ncbi:hypothetical protein NZD89_02640 [Alicyclobacillus fastidiosus]|uniref:Rod shape-determining protein MreD n=1 Tax=Alicyclobacillus fastidiosus TaxID=392011 RepID=A0ABY6ZHQ0_9BACL|nr:hypothetical protein [Alicyclobacillus fastidiosus]WAH42420.1 hypothetical protein NZD89_02640 [Alicyclobacillus fastidiosus]GMA64241.1 hypothetical protein GCM10025859_46810 [Alicyclobacillus fastidiosus]
MKWFLRNLVLLAGVSFALEYIWEAWQSPIFYMGPPGRHHTGSPGVGILLGATFGDMMMSIGLYLLLSLVNRDGSWFAKKYDAKDWTIMVLYALFFSFYFETRGLSTHRWGYSSLMPLFPGTDIGLVPVAQLLILFPLSFVLSRFIIKLFDKNRSSNTGKTSQI